MMFLRLHSLHAFVLIPLCCFIVACGGGGGEDKAQSSGSVAQQGGGASASLPSEEGASGAGEETGSFQELTEIDLEVTENSSDQLVLVWSSGGAERYRVIFDPSGGQSVDFETTATGLSVNSGLSAGQYVIIVEGYNSIGDSVFSQPVELDVIL